MPRVFWLISPTPIRPHAASCPIHTRPAAQAVLVIVIVTSVTILWEGRENCSRSVIFNLHGPSIHHLIPRSSISMGSQPSPSLGVGRGAGITAPCRWKKVAQQNAQRMAGLQPSRFFPLGLGPGVGGLLQRREEERERRREEGKKAEINRRKKGKHLPIYRRHSERERRRERSFCVCKLRSKKTMRAAPATQAPTTKP